MARLDDPDLLHRNRIAVFYYDDSAIEPISDQIRDSATHQSRAFTRAHNADGQQQESRRPI
jgi:hypothetical protein